MKERMSIFAKIKMASGIREKLKRKKIKILSYQHMDHQTNREYKVKLTKDIELGEKVRHFLESAEWGLINEYINNSILGLNDVSTINVTSERKAQAEVVGRQYTKNYLEGLRSYLQGLVQQGEWSGHELEKSEKGSSHIIRV